MDLYFELLKFPVFTIDDLKQYYTNPESARTAIKRLTAKGMATKIRRNLYTCISGETSAPVANRFQIASALTPTAYVSHHTAMEYYGITDQVFYEVYVASETEFQGFSFDGYTYRFVRSRLADGVEKAPFSGGIHITDRERTVLDSIKDMDKIAGAEEVFSNIQSIKRLSEEKLICYLDRYENQFLYQKTGYILSHMQNNFGLTDAFFTLCKEKAGKSTRYLSNEYKKGTFDAEWNLVIPAYLFESKNGGMADADI
ncbi:MAG: hypothetical protein K6C08_07780 [Oscillospiraceae bacterium]|nr:hypothetical protein [Oscillospiraceae bacterium]